MLDIEIDLYFLFFFMGFHVLCLKFEYTVHYCKRSLANFQ